MSEAQHQDDQAADILDVIGDVVGGLAIALGRPGAGLAVKAITHAASEAIRKRGVTTDQLVAALRHVGPLQMPWPTEPGK